jgi:probable F420-dependent oxidoreductase
MRFGLVTFITDQTMRPDELASTAEGLGFDSLFVCEHSNIPASRETPYPGDGPLPEEYYRCYDPFVALSWAASATTRIRLGTGMCLVIERDPIHTAKEVASLDQLSGGRFQFGVAAGWNREEMRQHGTDPTTRMRLLRERVLAIKALWANEIAEYAGEFVRIEPTTVRPQPVQRPNPPVVVGGMGPTVLDRVLEYGDAWAPNPGWPPMPELPDRMAELRRRSEEEGRGHIPVLIFGVAPDPDQVARYQQMGADEIIFLLPSVGPQETLAELKTIARAAAL